MISGSPIELENGWALMPFVGNRAHYWELDHKGENTSYYISLCGVDAVTRKEAGPLEPGNWPLCKRCTNNSKNFGIGSQP